MYPSPPTAGWNGRLAMSNALLLALLAGFCFFLTSNAHGQLMQVVTETHYADDGTLVGYPAGHTTYRIYAELADGTDALSAVFAEGSNTITLGSQAGGMWNSTFGGALGSDLNPAFISLFPATAYDSMVTVGRDLSDAPGGPITAISVLPNATVFQDNLGGAGIPGVNMNLIDGAWFGLATDINTRGVGPNFRVLIAQITCDGLPEYKLNIQVLDGGEGGTSLEYVWDNTNVGPDQIFNSSLAFDANQFPGCTDAGACNYNISAYSSDGSCFYADPLVCEVCSGEVDGTGTIVVEDFDGDGVCDAEDFCPTHPSDLVLDVVGGGPASAAGVNALDLAVSPVTGFPWVAYGDGDAGLQPSVRFYNGSTWQYAGPQGIVGSQIFEISLAFHPITGEPYIAYPDQVQGDAATVRRFDGAAWQIVGSAGFTPGTAQSLSLAFNPLNNNPTLAFSDFANGQGTSVMEFDGASWSLLGPAGFSPVQAFDHTLKFHPVTGAPLVCFKDVPSGEYASVMTFDGGSWSYVGLPSFTPDVADSPSMDIHPVTYEPYVAFHDATTLATSVMRFDGASWVAVGNPVVSAGDAFFQEIAFNPLTAEPYVVYQDIANSIGTSLVRFDGASWISTGGENISGGAASGQEIAFNPTTGVPYVAYKDEIDDTRIEVLSPSCAPSGCQDPGACNYDPLATFDDGSCSYPGCTDPAATCTYNPNAGCDDGSCEYPDACGVCDPVLYSLEIPPSGEYFILYESFTLDLSPYEGSVVTLEFQQITNGCSYTGIGNLELFFEFNGACLPSDYEYTESGGDSFDSFIWSGCSLFVNNGTSACADVPGIPFIRAHRVNVPVPVGQANQLSIELNAFFFLLTASEPLFFTIQSSDCVPIVEGCTNSSACNYNELANSNDGSCLFPGACDSCSGETDGTGTLIDGDTDDDGVCDNVDCAPNDPAIYPGLPCDDGLSCTENDVIGTDCNCTGTPVSCDDGDPCTVDICTEESGCIHTAPDGDGDGLCDFLDPCPDQVVNNPVFNWELVGPEGFSAGPVVDQRSAFGASSVRPYIAYINPDTGSPIVECFDGSAWTPINSAQLESNFVGAVDLAVHPFSGQPYIAFGNPTTVMRYDGSLWQFVGPPVSTTPTAGDQSLAFHPITGEPHVAFSNLNTGTISVQRFNGTDWEFVGYEAATPAAGFWPSLDLHPNTGEPYIAFEDFGAGGGDLSVQRFNGAFWVYAGSPGITGLSGNYPRIAISPVSGVAYITFTDGSNNNVSVMQFDGFSWGFTGGSPLSFEDTSYPAMEISPVTGDVYVVFSSSGSTSGPNMRRFDGSSWNLESMPGLAGPASTWPSLAMNPATGYPYVAFPATNLDNRATVIGYIPQCAIEGCTDAAACNYDAAAEIDNGSCEYPDSDGDGVVDCLDVCPDLADTLIGTSCDDGDPLTIHDTYQSNCECVGDYIGGCLDPAACNYDALAQVEDGSCFYIGDACDDENPFTTDDVLDATCLCAGTALDTDEDGLTDEEEVLIYGTDPSEADTDQDGLEDGAEVNVNGTDPLQDDTDGDGLTDGLEVNETLTDPMLPDTDGDGCTDYFEVILACPDSASCDTCPEDVNDDGEIGTLDLLGILGLFGTSCAP